MSGADDDSRPFALAICTLVVLPWALKKMRTAASTQTEMAKWRMLGFSAAAPVVQKEQRLAGSGWTRRLSWRNALFAALLATEALLIQEALADPPVVPPFDPYAALELDASVEGCSRRVTQWGEVKCAQATVRAAYRKLARRYHPDKTTGDEAKLRFEIVVKAHALLTNALAARNYAKYGHPDGYQGSRFGMALPAWAMPKHGKAMDMRGFVACFLIVVLLVPLLFYLSLRDPKGKRRARLAQRAQEVYLLAALGKTDAEADGLERALDMLTDPKGPSPALHADAVQASRLLGLALRSLQGEPVQGGARGQLSVEMRAALSSLDGASCAEAAAAAAAAAAAFVGAAAAAAAEASAAVQAAMEAAVEAGAKASSILDGASSAEAARVAAQAAQAAMEAAGAGLEYTPAPPLEYTLTEARSLLLRAYQRREPISPCLRAELAALLVDVPVVLESFFQSALMLKGLPYRYGAWPVLQVTQQLTQALSRGQPTALQAPHVTVERAALIQAALAGGESDVEGSGQHGSKHGGTGGGKRVETGGGQGGATGGESATGGADSDSHGTLSNGSLSNGSLSNGSLSNGSSSVATLSVWRLINVAAARRDTLLCAAGFGATEAADVCAFVKGVFPRARLDARVVVQGEESDEEGEGEGEGEGGGVVLVGDIVTICVTLTLAPRGSGYGNAIAKRRAALPAGCHAPQLPQAKAESWAVLVAALTLT